MPGGRNDSQTSWIFFNKEKGYLIQICFECHKLSSGVWIVKWSHKENLMDFWHSHSKPPLKKHQFKTKLHADYRNQLTHHQFRHFTDQ